MSFLKLALRMTLHTYSESLKTLGDRKCIPLLFYCPLSLEGQRTEVYSFVGILFQTYGDDCLVRTEHKIKYSNPYLSLCLSLCLCLSVPLFPHTTHMNTQLRLYDPWPVG